MTFGPRVWHTLIFPPLYLWNSSEIIVMSPSSSDQKFAQGQRWLSETEPELGMGILTAFDNRTLTLSFPQGDCVRQYSRSAAPVRRMRFKPGDRITAADGREIIVETLDDTMGILTYGQGELRICETELSTSLSVDLPFEKLISGLSDSSRLFDFRRKIRQLLADYQASPARGFLGGQVDLIPHQLYIADQVCSRQFPRVLLSDETGLGKTIEAGMVLHRLLITGRIRRVLIVVPQSLVHQWFIELFRKFSLRFRIFDRDYLKEAVASEPDMNPFSLDQQGIISQQFIMEHPKVREMILDAGWDMAVMDEAHHMTDDCGFYQFMAELGSDIRGLMLLTATPEQMGIQTHFAQLRLLDPDRYHDMDAYVQEAQGYEAAAQKALSLLEKGDSADRILDAFGPGRVVFRNRRRSIKGFPGREVNLVPLKGSRAQINAVNALEKPNTPETAGTAAAPSVSDLSDDPRVAHLADLCRSIKPEKILVICRSKELAGGIIAALGTHIAVDAARFDETMDLLARDRQAAWFADPDGARLLVCSEIGSEGRNFQFVRHLYLFDLPANPELLEQRIGRVDRIGQKQTIVIHVPYLRESVQEVLALWYDHGLGLFRENVNGLHATFTRFASRLQGLMEKTDNDRRVDQDLLRELLDRTAAHTRQTMAELDQGRHILLELNSFRAGPAERLIETVRKTEQARELYDLMEKILDHFGVEMDFVGRSSPVVSLKSDRVVDEDFPALPGGARFLTFDRATAISRDDLDFLTWDHPFVHQVLEYFITRGEGAAATAVLEGAGGPGLILEVLFLLELPETGKYPAAREFLPSSPVHILMDHTGRVMDATALGAEFPRCLKPDKPGWFLDLPQVRQDLLPDLLDKCQVLAEEEAEQMRRQGVAALKRRLGAEVERLVDLSRVNPGVTQREVEAARTEQEALEAMISGAKLRLDGVRLIRC